MMNVEITDLTRRFGRTQAVAGVDLQAGAGVYGLLGPNGAGKTSLVRLLLGILRPDSGTIAYRLRDDGPAWPDPAELGYLPEDRGLYKDIPVLCTLVYFRDAEERRLALVYLYKRGTFYPFAPMGGEKRDNELELHLKGILEKDLKVEQDLTRWFPVWGVPVS